MKTLAIEVRKAEPRDAAAIADVHQQAWQGAYSGIIPHGALRRMIARRGVDWWERAIRRSGNIIVLDAGGTIAGYATLGRNRAGQLSQQGEIYELYLRPEWQGVGLGRKLFRTARVALKNHGLKGLVVWALEENTGALSFYLGEGGRDVAEGVEIFDQKALKKIAFVWE